MAVTEADLLLDFVMHPYWAQAEGELTRLVRQLEAKAARAKGDDHEFERGRLDGAERAATVLQEWRKTTQKELLKSARS